MPAPAIILELVERFERNLAAYKSGSYNETQVSREFLDPFFKALGWDANNRQGWAEAYKEVIHEDAIKVGGATKAPDYCFRVGGAAQVLPRSQKARRQHQGRFSSSVPASPLRLVAPNCRSPSSATSRNSPSTTAASNPTRHDKAATGAHSLLRLYRNTSTQWDEIAAVFSRTPSSKAPSTSSPDRTRTSAAPRKWTTNFSPRSKAGAIVLARNLALRNPQTEQRELNYAVQGTIDRIIFLRICEERGIEPYGRLQQLLQRRQRLCAP